MSTTLSIPKKNHPGFLRTATSSFLSVRYQTLNSSQFRHSFVSAVPASCGCDNNPRLRNKRIERVTSVGRLRHLLPHTHTNDDAGRNNQRGGSSSRHHRVQKLYFRRSCLPGAVVSSHFSHAGPFDRIPSDPFSVVRSVKPIVAVSNEGNILPLMPFRSAHQAAAALVIASPQLFWLKFNSLVQHMLQLPLLVATCRKSVGSADRMHRKSVPGDCVETVAEPLVCVPITCTIAEPHPEAPREKYAARFTDRLGLRRISSLVSS